VAISVDRRRNTCALSAAGVHSDRRDWRPR